MEKLFITFLLTIPLFLFSQGENDNWYFGDHAAVNFSTQNNPVALNNSQMNAYEACGSVSDSNGNLLFYTNGLTVWNRDHQIMDNGTGLHGHDSSGQLLIIKSPSNPNEYFLFTVFDFIHDFNFPNDPTNVVKYSVIDMTQGGNGQNGLPLGAVSEKFKNITVFDNNGDDFRTEGITVIPKPNDQSYWILLIKNNTLFSFNLNNLGFNNGNPVISTPSNSPNLSNATLWLNASNRVNYTNAFTNFISVSSAWMFSQYIYSYNANTGSLTNDYILTVNADYNGKSEFSGNANIYYSPSYHAIYAVDLASGNYIHGIPDGCQSQNCDIFIQRNKYDDLYYTLGDSQYLGKINNPNVFGTSVSLNEQAIFLNNGISKYSLPDLIPDLSSTVEPCPNNLDLTSPETNSLYVYTASNSITTHTNYVVSPVQTPNQNITLKAGNHISLLPNTEIRMGSVFLATIEDCENVTKSSKQLSARFSKVINLPESKLSTITISPNPSSTYFNINVGKEKLISWELYDMSGRNILKGNSNEVNVQSLPKGVYMLRINTGKKQTTQKVIVN